MASNAVQFYGLPKGYKEHIPLRPIFFLPPPTNELANESPRNWEPLINGSNYSVINAYRFLEKLDGVTLEEDETSVSSDINALFTPNDLNLAKTISKKLLQGHYLEKTIGNRHSNI